MTSSFHLFRLGQLASQQPLPPHLANTQSPIQINSSGDLQQQPTERLQHQPATSYFATSTGDSTQNFVNTLHHDPTSASRVNTKQPYGSGDSDDGYTLVFPNLEAFNKWRGEEEEREMVEFVKGDTHGSKAIPPRFKDHTKLVCARHSRSGRKKYVKKHPERVRKVPSRKIEGTGCPASISYKTYYDAEIVRACYQSVHSHETGLANLPFTRRGRRQAVQQEKEKSHRQSAQASTPGRTPEGETQTVPVQLTSGVAPSPSNGPSPFHPSFTMATQMPEQSQPPVLSASISRTSTTEDPMALMHPFSHPNQPHALPGPPPQPLHSGLLPDRWENISTLFSAIRETARSFEYPFASVAALEAILLRLYLETPVSLGGGNPNAIMTFSPQGQLTFQPRAQPLVQSQLRSDNNRPPTATANHTNGSSARKETNEEEEEEEEEKGGGEEEEEEEDNPS